MARFLPFGAALVLLAAACGSDEPSSGASTSATTTVPVASTAAVESSSTAASPSDSSGTTPPSVPSSEAAAPNLAEVRVALTEIGEFDEPVALVERQGTLYLAEKGGRVLALTALLFVLPLLGAVGTGNPISLTVMLNLAPWFGLLVLMLETLGRWSQSRLLPAVGTLVLVIFAEVVCAGLLVLGLFTRAAALVLAFTMAVAFYHGHGAKLTGMGNDGEIAFLFLGVFVALFLMGGGRFSLDAKMGAKG